MIQASTERRMIEMLSPDRNDHSFSGLYLRNSITMAVTSEAGGLFLQKNNGARQSLIPKSETSFIAGGGGLGLGYVFTVEDEGEATTISEVHVR